jgi:predicted HicB family RNase H-like nuclease
MKPGYKYLKIVEWSDEDQCYIGTCPTLFDGGVHGDNEAAVYSELCEVVEEWMQIHAKDGIPLPAPIEPKNYSGKFNFRPGKELHKELALRAVANGKSLNTYCRELIESALHA